MLSHLSRSGSSPSLLKRVGSNIASSRHPRSPFHCFRSLSSALWASHSALALSSSRLHQPSSLSSLRSLHPHLFKPVSHPSHLNHQHEAAFHSPRPLSTRIVSEQKPRVPYQLARALMTSPALQPRLFQGAINEQEEPLASRQPTRKAQVYFSQSTDPFFNLAVERWLQTSPKEPDSQVFFWYRNAPSVSVGRYQDPWMECNIHSMQDNGIHLVRRYGGGGIQYSDLGNSNFLFVGPKDEFSSERNAKILQKALERLGIHVKTDDKGELKLNGKSITSAAFKRVVPDEPVMETPKMGVQHGTFTLETDQSALQRFLNPRKARMVLPNLNTVEGRELNLRHLYPTVDHDILGHMVRTTFLEEYGYTEKTARVHTIDEKFMEEHPEVASIYKSLKDWDYRMGNKPNSSHQLSHQFDWGHVDLYLNVDDMGRISDVQMFTDSIHNPLVEAVQQHIPGIRVNKSELRQAMEKIREQLRAHGAESEGLVDDLSKWLKKQNLM